MGSYLVSFTGRTPLSVSSADPDGTRNLRHRWQFADRKVEILAYDLQDSAPGLHQGIRFDVSLMAPDIEDAVAEAGGWVDGVAALLSVVSQTWVDPVRFELAYDVTPEANRRKYVRDFRLEEAYMAAPRRLDVERYGAIMRAFGSYEATLDRSPMKRRVQESGLHRALSWLRKALLEPVDPVDEFISY